MISDTNVQVYYNGAKNNNWVWHTNIDAGSYGKLSFNTDHISLKEENISPYLYYFCIFLCCSNSVIQLPAKEYNVKVDAVFDNSASQQYADGLLMLCTADNKISLSDAYIAGEQAYNAWEVPSENENLKNATDIRMYKDTSYSELARISNLTKQYTGYGKYTARALDRKYWYVFLSLSTRNSSKLDFILKSINLTIT